MKKLVLLMALAGCAGISNAPVPQAARLSATQLTVTLTDATICRANWAEQGGAGQLNACGAGYDYRVTVVENPNILATWVQELALALNAGSAFPPLAEVTLTNATGKTWRFTSPPPVPLN